MTFLGAIICTKMSANVCGDLRDRSYHVGRSMLNKRNGKGCSIKDCHLFWSILCRNWMYIVTCVSSLNMPVAFHWNLAYGEDSCEVYLRNLNMRFEVLTAVTVEVCFLWNLASCRLRFTDVSETSHFHVIWSQHVSPQVFLQSLYRPGHALRAAGFRGTQTW